MQFNGLHVFGSFQYFLSEWERGPHRFLFLYRNRRVVSILHQMLLTQTGV